MTGTEKFPAAVPWAPAAVRLLKGIVYSDDPGDAWEQILSGLTPLGDHFARIGLRLVLNEEDGMAYLTQLDATDLPTDYPSIPKLFHSIPLSFEASLLCVLLREELRRFDEEIHSDGRCVVTQAALLELWQEITPNTTDPVRLNKALGSQLKKLEDLRFVRRFEDDPPSWEVRRILKAKLSLDDYERLRADLEGELVRRMQTDTKTVQDHADE